MDEVVKADRRAQRRAETERRLVEAASELFVERGYAATTLADVADRAGLAPRTLYLHVPTKADLLLRCIGVAIVGDALPVPLADRPVLAATMAGATLEERVERMAALSAELMGRAGPLLEVARQAAPTEPAIEAAAAAGRADTARAFRDFWARLHDDGLLPAGVDLGWLTDTATVLAHAETYLLIRRTTGWDLEAYRRWLVTTWLHLATGC